VIRWMRLGTLTQRPVLLHQVNWSLFKTNCVKRGLLSGYTQIHIVFDRMTLNVLLIFSESLKRTVAMRQKNKYELVPRLNITRKYLHKLFHCKVCHRVNSLEQNFALWTHNS
jgi:hypothetical protein